jgi:hypothetical protein
MARADTTRDIGQSEVSMLGIYLNDHLAGATAGTELAHRMARSHGDGQDGSTLRRLAAEIAQDRAALLDIMAALGIKVRCYKVSAAWIGEKAGRLKFNGRLFTRSPLSDLEELEMLRLGVEGKAAGWRTLRTLADSDTRLDPARLDELIAGARRQADVLEDLRVAAASRLSGHVRPSHGIRRFLRTRGATGSRGAGRGGVRSTVSAIAVQAAPSVVSAVAAPLSRARNAKMPASAWRGATNASTITISVLACASGTTSTRAQ